MIAPYEIEITAIEEKYNYHKAEMEKWGFILGAIKELDASNINNHPKSASARVIEIAIEILKTGQSVAPFTNLLFEKINKEGWITKGGRKLNRKDIAALLAQSKKVKIKIWQLAE